MSTRQSIAPTTPRKIDYFEAQRDKDLAALARAKKLEAKHRKKLTSVVVDAQTVVVSTNGDAETVRGRYASKYSSCRIR